MNINKRFLTALLIVMMLASLTSCYTKSEGTPTISINGNKNIELSFGESITFSAEVRPSGSKITWSVDETNLGDEYTLVGSTFTAKQTAGYAVIKANGSKGVSDYVTIVINHGFSDDSNTGDFNTGAKVTFYAVDGKTIIDVRYADANGRVIFPDYTVGDQSVIWTDSNGKEVDPSSVTVTSNTRFTAKELIETVIYTVRFWYYNNNGKAVQVGESFKLDFNHGESVSPEQRAAIEASAEKASGKQIVNWNCKISADGTVIDWYAEFAK